MVPEQTIVEKVVEAHKSNDLTPLVSWLERLGCKDISRDGDTATLTGLTGPTLLEKVNKLWKAELKKAKEGNHAKD